MSEFQHNRPKLGFQFRLVLSVLFTDISFLQVSNVNVDNQDLEINEIRRFELLRNELIELEKRVQRSTDESQNEEVIWSMSMNIFARIYHNQYDEVCLSKVFLCDKLPNDHEFLAQPLLYLLLLYKH